MSASATGSRLSVLAMLMALGGAAFWWYDGMVLLEPLLNGTVALDLSALGAPARAADREPAPRSDELSVEDPVDELPSWEGPDGADPLARFGSWIGSEPMRQVFLPTSPRPDDVDAVAGEVSGAGQDAAGSGGDQPSAAVGPPPEHVVSVVMVADRERLAVVDGAVVAVGDQLQAGQVVEIHDDGVLVRTAAGLVSYTIGSPRGQDVRGTVLPSAGPRTQR